MTLFPGVGVAGLLSDQARHRYPVKNATAAAATHRPVCASQCPEADHSRLAKLSSPRLLAAQQRLDVSRLTAPTPY
jgi:hypothetical protein